MQGQPIFRIEATRRYQESQAHTVLPRLVAPPIRRCLWILLGLLLAGGGIVGLTPVPVYVSCPAVVIDGHNRVPAMEGEIAIVAFVPLEHLARVRRGQPLWVPLAAARERFRQQVSGIDPQVRSPETVHRQFALPATAALTMTRPVALVLARFEHVPPGLPAAAYVGSVYQVEIEVGTRRLSALLPLGHLGFPEERL